MICVKQRTTWEVKHIVSISKKITDKRFQRIRETLGAYLQFATSHNSNVNFTQAPIWAEQIREAAAH